MTTKNYNLNHMVKRLAKIFRSAIINKNYLCSIAFLAVIPLFTIAETIEINNIDYEVCLFKGKDGYTLKQLFFNTVKVVMLKLIASVITDLSTAKIFYTGLELSLSDFLGLSWNTYHKYSIGELLTMQYEKGESITKFLFELFVSLIVNLYKISLLIKKISQTTHSAIGIGLIFGTLAHIIFFFISYKTYNFLQIKCFDAASKARSLVESESKNFAVVKTYDLAETSVKRVERRMEHRKQRNTELTIFDGRSTLFYKFFEIFSLLILYVFNYCNLIDQTVLNSVSKQVVMLYEGMRDLITALGELRKEFHLFYSLDDIVDTDNVEKVKLDCFKELICEDVTHNGLFGKINLTVTKKQKIAIVGCNGSGKTVFLRTLAKLYDSDGKISINSVDINKVNTKDYHKIVTFISQNDNYTEGTVMKNLKYGNYLSSEQIIEKCKYFNVDYVFNGLDKGYHKHSNSLGVDLSGGQNQRVGFMRGVLRETPILIIDDCLTNVNTNDRNFLMEKLFTLNERSIIMTCDKFEMLHKFDQIVLISKSISKVGTFDDLESDLNTFFNK